METLESFYLAQCSSCATLFNKTLAWHPEVNPKFMIINKYSISLTSLQKCNTFWSMMTRLLRLTNMLK